MKTYTPVYVEIGREKSPGNQHNMNSSISDAIKLKDTSGWSQSSWFYSYWREMDEFGSVFWPEEKTPCP